MTKIKICGLRREEDICYVNECKPDYIGFVFAESKRKVTKEEAKKLKELLSSDILSVGVFVNEEITKLAEIVNEGIIDIVQLHGEETDAYIDELRKYINDTKIIKAVRVASKEDVYRSEKTHADYLLFDTFSKDAYGGTGKAFDWSCIKEVKRPFFLAGGIGIYNVQEAIKTSGAYAVDVSSSVETNGYKDREKVLEIVKRVKR